MTSAFISPSQVITFLHHKGQKKFKKIKIQIQSSNIVSPAFTRRGEEDSEWPACVNTQRGAHFLLCRPRGGVEGEIEGGELVSRWPFVIETIFTSETQNGFINSIRAWHFPPPAAGVKINVMRNTAVPPPPKLFLCFSLPLSLFLHLFLSADSQHVHWHKCSFFCFCSLQPCTSGTSHPQKSVCLTTLGQTYTKCTLPYAHTPTRLLNMHLITNCSTTAGQCCCMCAGLWSYRTRVGRAEALLHSAEADLSVLPRQ